MNKKTFTLLLFCLFAFQAFSQTTQKYTISGYIEDGFSGEKLISANIFDYISAKGTVTNTYGFYSITLPEDSVYLSFSYIGYQTKVVKLKLDKNMELNIKLSSSIELETVEVIAEKQTKIEEETQMSVVQVPVEQIKKVPALLGEVDVLKVLQLLPGVQSGGEGQSGLYVRGGSPDQNLILLDGVPVYNVSHLLGFFSVFNADAIKNVTLTKGGFPARYGGRLSSVLEINMKEGNNQKFGIEGSFGLVASKLTIEAPIIKNKTSFIVSGRRTYIDFIGRPVIKSQQTEDQQFDLKLYFYDLNAKINHKINEKHRLFLSAYLGEDVFGVKSLEKYDDDDYFQLENSTDWGNTTAAFRWNYMISNKLFANTTLTYSKYKIDIVTASEDKYGDNFSSFGAKYFSGITDYAGKIDFDYIPDPNHFVRFGTSVTHHTYDPGAFQFELAQDDLEFDTILGSQQAKSLEYALYVEDDMQLGALKANIGIHASGFKVRGNENEFYYSVQPRVGLRYLLDNQLAIKASFSTMAQYINLLTNESLSFPTDLWVPSTKRVKPQTSWQAALGVAKTLWKDYEFSVEGYYKEMKNVISYKEGVDFIGLENDWQDKVTQGDGEAYGVELFFQKKKGKTTGWVGYTLSWNFRQFDDINSGEKFPFKYDRRHDISIVVSHQITDRISFTGAWVYGTGNSITLPLFRYNYPVYVDPANDIVSTREIETIGSKNEFRMDAYHRLDLNIEFYKKRGKYERWWIIGAYNVYNRKNPYFIYAARDRFGERAFKQVSLFPVIPSVTYRFKI
jgi:outer membrane cobalamin receptor